MAYRQDKATTEKHARILRELVKQPGNKICADCKRQDARWASWNIGVFICIRCSGIHRSMGTHISKVKSVDLDTWNPEQMDSIQKWGNHRANLYWEAHLRPGHVPPEHKLESFIRSKYESRRWARDGPPPIDPSILESAEETLAQASTITPTDSPVPVPGGAASPTPTSLPVTSRQPQPHRLLSASIAGRPSAAQPVQAAASAVAQQTKAPEPEPPKPAASEPQNDLFSLDFHAPTPPATQQQAPRKDVKNDILSLFSSSTPSSATTAVPPSNTASGQFNASSASQWGQSAQPVPQGQPQPQSISMMGTTGTAMWGAQSGWAPPPAPVQPDVWGGFQTSPTPNTATTGVVAPVVAQQISTQSLFETQNVWGANPSTVGPSAAGTGVGVNGMAKNDLFGSSFSAAPATSTQKKDDVFGDLWGDFK